MTYKETVAEMRQYSDPRAKDSWERLGFDPARSHGVSLTNLKKVAKVVKRDHELALQLWNSGNYDEMLLATLVEEPLKVTEDQLDKQVQDIAAWGLGDKFCRNVVVKTPFHQKKAEEWSSSQMEFIKHCGYILVMELAKSDKNLQDEYFEPYLIDISNIQQEPNWVKESMNYALLAIGSRNKNLHAKALEVAQKIGKVEVDYGDTSCQTTDTYKILNSKIF